MTEKTRVCSVSGDIVAGDVAIEMGRQPGMDYTSADYLDHDADDVDVDDDEDYEPTFTCDAPGCGVEFLASTGAPGADFSFCSEHADPLI